jgi:hypothetical protein
MFLKVTDPGHLYQEWEVHQLLHPMNPMNASSNQLKFPLQMVREVSLLSSASVMKYHTPGAH